MSSIKMNLKSDLLRIDQQIGINTPTPQYTYTEFPNIQLSKNQSTPTHKCEKLEVITTVNIVWGS